MAVTKLARNGYGQLERNRVQTHNVESQCELDATVFPNGAEVGSLVAVDKAAGKIKLTGGPIGLLANAEVLYYPTKMGLKDYHLEGGQMASVIFPEVGNTWTTNTVVYDSTTYADGYNTVKENLKAGTAVYGVQHAATGEVELVATSANAPGNMVLQAVAATTMPDGQKAIKFMVVKNG